MPTDSELRTLFRDAPASESKIDTATVIRRSKRRRLPQQLGAGSVLTLAATGIGVASISGLQWLIPRTASDLAADAPTSVSEGAPFAEADSGAATRESACTVGDQDDATVADGLSLATHLPGMVSAGHPVTGSLILTNTGDEAIAATVVEARIGVSGGDTSLQSTADWHSDGSEAGTRVELAPGESTTLGFTFDAIDCSTDSTPLEPGEYRVSAFLDLLPDDGGVEPARGFNDDGEVEVVGGGASVITVR